MIYLKSFKFPDEDMEFDFIIKIQRTCYDSFYPFKVLSGHKFKRIDFEPVTILYGGNGSGKSTALNVIAEKTKIIRDSIYNKSNFYPDYVNMCEMSISRDIPGKSRIITSDDVFDYMLNIRALNEKIDNKREVLIEEHYEKKKAVYHLKSLEDDDYEEFKRIQQVKRKSQSQFVRSNVKDNIPEYSNGENAFKYFAEKIVDDSALYILDEPENSLSPARQIELADFISDSARFFECQFIISTHSPFFLAMKGAKIYDLDENPVTVKRWTELENVRAYYEFFKAHDEAF